MNLDIYVEFNNNNLSFQLFLPSEFMEKDIEIYSEIESESFYECNINSLNFNELTDKLKTFIVKHKDFLDIKNIESLNFQVIQGSNENLYKFLKVFENQNIEIQINNFKDFISNTKNEDYKNLKIRFKNSTDILTHKEFKEMYNKLNEIIEFVKHYNLSPLERVMLVYDIVKSNKYRQEKRKDSCNISRNLNQILNSNKIVCVGFANLLDYLLINLDIDSNIITLQYKNKKSGHERNYIHLIDEKYNINGVFFLDATWDSKKSDEYLDNYRFFLKPFRYFKYVNPTENVSSQLKFSVLEKSCEETIDELDKNNYYKSIKFLMYLNSLEKTFNKNLTETNFMNLLNVDNEVLKEKIKLVFKLYSKTIKESAFKNALYKIRKIEYINGIIDYEPTEEIIDNVCNRYFKETSEIRLLKALNLYEEPTLDEDLKEAKANSVEEDLLRMRFLKALKNEIGDLPENDFIKKM